MDMSALALVLAIMVTIVCVVAFFYSIVLFRFFKGGVLSPIWVGICFASLFLIFCSVGTISDILSGREEEHLLEVLANLGIALSLAFSGWRSDRFWRKQKPS